MQIFPAIDLRGGQVVRLYQGDYDQETVYAADPCAVARDFLAAGARYLHVVDLDGARDGTLANFETIAALVRQGGLYIEVGGGIRTEERIRRYLDLGVGRCILGTIAVKDFAFTERMAQKYGDRIAVGVDARDGFVAVSGWKELSEERGVDFCRRLRDAGVKTVIYTDISRDGAEQGTNLDLYRELAGIEGLDITASAEGRNLFTDILRAVASEIFIPLTVGGGIRTLDDFDRVLKCGADKVSVNSGAIADPSLIGAAAKKYGDQCVVLSMDVKRVDGQFRLFAKGGREDTGIDAMEWAVRGVENGAGEIVLNSIDTDGVKEGFDLPMLDALAARVGVPIIASGGAGKMEDFAELFTHPGIDAGLAASIFHTGEVDIRSLKRYLRDQGVEMRL